MNSSLFNYDQINIQLIWLHESPLLRVKVTTFKEEVVRWRLRRKDWIEFESDPRYHHTLQTLQQTEAL